MPGDALKSQTPKHSENFTRKARVLLELFGPNGLERLEGAGLAPGIMKAIAEAQDAAPGPSGDPHAGRDGLLHRFRERGLLDRAASDPAPAAIPRTATAVPPGDIRSAVGHRIAAHLSDGDLEQENPAVIALVLKSQPKSVQARVLRALPGACARATIRHMKR
jgi:hypothetical protein